MASKLRSVIIAIGSLTFGAVITLLHVYLFYNAYKIMSPQNALELSKSLIEVNGFIISFSIVINFFLLSKINDFRDKIMKVTFPPIKYLMIQIDKTSETLSKLKNSGEPKTKKVNDDILELSQNLSQYEPALGEYESSFDKIREVTQNESKQFLRWVAILIILSMTSIMFSFGYIITLDVLDILMSINMLLITLLMEIALINNYNTSIKLLDDGVYDLTKHLVKLKLKYEKNIKNLEYK